MAILPSRPPPPSAMRNLISVADRAKSLSINGLRLLALRNTGNWAIAPFLFGFLYLPRATEKPRCVTTRVPSSRTAHGITTPPMCNSPEWVALGMGLIPFFAHRASTALRAIVRGRKERVAPWPIRLRSSAFTNPIEPIRTKEYTGLEG